MMPNSEGSGNVVSVGDLGVGVHHGGGGDMNNSVNGGCDGNGGESNLKKGPWTAEEDAVLVEYVRKHGEGNWNAVQRHSGLARCGKSCRLRWANHLRPNLKKGSFSPEEERLIVELHAKFGNKWARMASLLPGRTDNEIKNYWNTRVKRHQRQGLPLYPPDVQPQHLPSPHFHHHSPSPSISAAAPMPTSSFTFQTQFSNSSTPITPTSATPPPLSPATTSTSFPTLPLFDYSQPSPHHHHLHHHSTPTTPTSSFSFPTQQLHSPNNNRTPSTPPPLSPLSSPSTNPNSSFPTLPLLDFNAHRTPPILQSPIRFKRFASNPDISNLHHRHHQSPPDHMNNNFSLLSQMGNHQHQHHQLPNFSDYSGNDFHSELQKENQEMCSLLASVTQQQQSPELPLNQFLSGRNLGMGVNNGSSKIGRRMSKRKYLKEKVNGKLGITLMEELLQECGNINTNTDHHHNNSLINLQYHNNFPLNWDNPIANSIAFSSEKGGEEEMMNTTIMAEDLQKVLNRYSIPTMQQEGELYSESADMSNGQSSVVTTDENNNINIGGGGYHHHHHEMQHIASMFPPVVSEHDVRNLATCSWDNLPGIC